MRCSALCRRVARFCLLWGFGAYLTLETRGAPGQPAGITPTNSVVLLDIAGAGEVLAAGDLVWREATVPRILNIGDRFRTGPSSRATLRLSDLSLLRLGELSELEVRPDPDVPAPPIFRLWRGVLYFFHRDKPGRFRFDTPHASGAVRGTEFTLEVTDPGRSVVTLIDGFVELTTPAGRAVGGPHRRVVADGGGVPVVTAVIEADLVNAMQWFLYYPAVLDVDDLRLEPPEALALAASVAAYRDGDLLAALRLAPPEAPVPSVRERFFRAALFLAVGQVDRAQGILGEEEARPGGESLRPIARAMGRLIATVKGDAVDLFPENAPLASASEWLAESYARQAAADLPGALTAARRATGLAPGFGFAWARVAELEFGFGRIQRASQALERAQILSPRNAPAAALRGFLRAANDDIRGAQAEFDRTIALDGSLGHGWLGRGLCRIRHGEMRAGMLDLETAAVVEPRRSLLRSYLGKGYEAAEFTPLAKAELELARRLDPLDPTPWLYGALLRREQNEVNRAIGDLERSLALNDQRALSRSRLLLDEDRAVRSSSLAGVYQAAGLREASLQEAVRAERADYGNYSAHRFVSDSFNLLREPTRSNLRFETVWFNELLLADLLAPVGGTPLSRPITEQEYARLFDRDRVGFSSATDYRSDGQVREVASQFGRIERMAWALDLDAEHHDGVRPNNALDRAEWYSTFQYQWTPQDSALLLAKYQDFHSGDTLQYYSSSQLRPRYRFDEPQHPILVAGYHHEWGPGMHTLVLGGRLASEVTVSDVAASQWVRLLDAAGRVVTVSTVGLDVRHRVDLEIFHGEAQQVFENERQALVLGLRAQGGGIDTRSRMSNPDNFAADFSAPASAAAPSEDFSRISGYAYETVKLADAWQWTGGLTYESMQFPRNFRNPPVADGGERRERLLPKAAVTWDVTDGVALRAAWLRSLGGVSLDESYRLEPAQVAGFVQDYRTLIPESLVSSVSAPDHEVWGAAVDWKFRTRTYVTLEAQRLLADVHRSVGAFDYLLSAPLPPRIAPTSLRQRIDEDERTARVSVHQLLAEEWALGLRYAYTRTDLGIRTPALDGPGFSGRSGAAAEWHEIAGTILYNHPSGFFGELEARWETQRNFGPSASLAGDSFAQLDCFAGYRLTRQRGDLTFGLLNATGDNYRLNPVTVHPEFPREQVFYARVRFKF